MLSASLPAQAGQPATTGAALVRQLPGADGGGRVTAETARRRALLRATIDPRRRQPGLPRVRIRRSFIGLSYEYQQLAALISNDFVVPDRPAEAMLAHLAAGGMGSPTVRVGGGSTDDSFWNPNHVKPRPRGIAFDLDQVTLDALSSFHRRTHTPFILGLNLANPQLRTATEWLRVAHARLGRAVRAYELGNEPDIYTSRGYGEDAQGRSLKARPKGWGILDLVREFLTRGRALRSIAKVPLAGPGLCCLDTFRRRLPYFFAKTRKLISLATTHSYSGAACPGIKRSNPDALTVRRLLSRRKLQTKLAPISNAILAARHYHKRLRVTEVGSAACGGKRGVSDRYASALWGADFTLAMAAFGADGADFHTSGVYTPVSFSYSRPRKRWSGYARPLYYGLLLASKALPAGARMLPAATFRARQRKGTNVTLWASIDRHRTIRVVVVNKDLRARGRVRLRVRRGRARGKLTRLLGPGPRAAKGITYGGRTIPLGSATGAFTGRARSPRIRRRHGSYSFSMRPASAALLEIRTRR